MHLTGQPVPSTLRCEHEPHLPPSEQPFQRDLTAGRSPARSVTGSGPNIQPEAPDHLSLSGA